MNIYLPGPSTTLRYTISCGVELASLALAALDEHVCTIGEEHTLFQVSIGFDIIILSKLLTADV